MPPPNQTAEDKNETKLQTEEFQYDVIYITERSNLNTDDDSEVSNYNPSHMYVPIHFVTLYAA